MRPTRELGRATLERSPIRSCTGWGLPSFPGHPGNWCALTAPFHPYPETPRPWAEVAGRFAFCCTFLRVTATPRYGAPCPVVFGLSSGHHRPAIVCPTPPDPIRPPTAPAGGPKPIPLTFPSKSSADSEDRSAGCRIAGARCKSAEGYSCDIRSRSHRSPAQCPRPFYP